MLRTTSFDTIQRLGGPFETHHNGKIERLTHRNLVLQHIGEMTVRETFDFAARCQGAGTKKGQQ